MKKILTVVACITLIIFLASKYDFNNFYHGYDIQQLIYFSVILASLIIFVFRSKISLKDIFCYSILWSAVGVSLLIIYSYKNDIYKISQKLYANLVPGYVISSEKNPYQATIIANQDGHFYVNALVNEGNVKFVVDTGATIVTLSWQDARNIGINPNELNFSTKTMTANGPSFSAPIFLNEIRIGNIIIKNISANVGSSNLDTSLLGMNFLKRLQSFEFVDNSLIMISEN